MPTSIGRRFVNVIPIPGYGSESLQSEFKFNIVIRESKPARIETCNSSRLNRGSLPPLEG
jgi:hypothetical protein